MTLLLDQRGADVLITEKVVKAAAANNGNGKVVMMLLLDQREEEVIKSLVRIRENNSGIKILGARLFCVRSSSS